MIVSPLQVIEQGWLEFPSYFTKKDIDKAVQPNAIDLSFESISEVTGGPFILGESYKQMREYHQLQHPLSSSEKSRINIPDTNYEDWFEIKPQSAYDISTDFKVTVPDGVVALIINRSTLLRSHIQAQSAIYDSGFETHHAGFMLFNNSLTSAYLARRTRLAQIIFIAGQSSGISYNGSYQGLPQGTHWSTALQ